MSLGGGLFATENKVMPGAYINFVSTSRGSFNISERGVGAIGMELDWGGAITELEADSIRQNCKALTGHNYTDDEMLYVREFFKHGNKLYLCRINPAGTMASCDYARAMYAGTRGNCITIGITRSIDYTGKYEFTTYIDDTAMDVQVVSKLSELKSNDYVRWIGGTAIEVGMYKLTGGTSGEVKGETIELISNMLESYRFNALTILTEDETFHQVMIEFTKRMRDERGIKFQYIAYNVAADYEGVINVTDSPEDGVYSGLCPWVCGVCAGCGINETATNMKYDGEQNIIVNSNQSYLERMLELGAFLMHKVGDDIRVLKDINSLVSFNVEKGQVFQNNQTVRVCDQIASDTAELFVNYYLGKVPNDKAGRSALWCELVKYHEKLNDMRAIEGFSEDDIEVSQGEEKTSVIVSESIAPVNSMDKLYMKVYIE